MRKDFMWNDKKSHFAICHIAIFRHFLWILVGLAVSDDEWDCHVAYFTIDKFIVSRCVSLLPQQPTFLIYFEALKCFHHSFIHIYGVIYNMMLMSLIAFSIVKFIGCHSILLARKSILNILENIAFSLSISM